jgi:beta-galactosidase
MLIRAYLVLAALLLAASSSASPAHSFQIEKGRFVLDGKPFVILAGEIHPSRVPKEYWRQRIQMAKAMGLNTISVYIFWNMHEPEKGKFDFKGNQDVAKFIRVCQEEGMWVILRPGPYVCAEWEFGGYPYWLLNEPGLLVRSKEPQFMKFAKRYLQRLADQTAPLQISHGGNILMVQVENEYGSYGRDKEYMAMIRDDLKEVGYDVPLYVAEGGAQLASAWIPGTVAGVNGGGWPDAVRTADRYTPGGPYIVPEFYPGWLDHWGEPKSITNGGVSSFIDLVRHDVSVSLYMFHGGTNFGFMNGANYGGGYEPDITSYDYDAPLDEAGRPRKKYFEFRDALSKLTGVTPPSMPATNPVTTIPKFALAKKGSVFGFLPKPVHSDTPKTMEALGQAYGFVLYRTHVKGPKQAALEIKELRDYAVVMVNGKTVTTLDRRRKQQSANLDLPDGDVQLDLLVENSGRINYSSKIPDNHKGITGKVLLGGQELKSWDNYSLPMLNPARFALDGQTADSPALYRGEFKLDSTGDAFLDLRGWTKGVVWINGHNLGRYWWIGPQQTLYVPGVWLKKGKNEAIVFEEVKTDSPTLQALAAPILTDLRHEPVVTKRGRVKLDGVPQTTDADLAFSGQLAQGDAAQRFLFPAMSGRYLCVETDSTFANETFASLSEIDLMGTDGFLLDRSNWKIAYVDSEETAAEDGAADNLLDGDLDSIWHSVWSTDHTPNPHRVVIDLGSDVTAAGVRLTPRQGDSPGKVKAFKVFLSKSAFGTIAKN